MKYWVSLALILGLTGCQNVPELSPEAPETVTLERENDPEELVAEIVPENEPMGIDYAEEEAAFQSSDLPIELIELPDGFTIEVVATHIKNARSMALSDNGTLYVGSRAEGKVYALEDRNNNGKTDKMTVVASGLNSPNGVALKEGDLYVAEINRILKFSDIEDTKYDLPEPEVIYDDYPTDASHGWKYIAFGPDEKLYVPVGAPCNLCDPEAPLYSTITRLDVEADPSPIIIAKGIRNSVGFDWHPETNVLWFTENGRDWMGDDWPPDELNVLKNEGSHFGFPYCHGNEPDPDFGVGKNCADYVAPVQALKPHVAALGMKFYTGDQFPQEYRQQIFIAEHGSWNRTNPIGYQVSLVRLEGEASIAYEPFATGWLQDGDAWGRPVDILVEAEGSLLVSDDASGTIYRIKYHQQD